MLELDNILMKTPKGVEEIEKRTHKLSPKFRAALILVDGDSTLGEIMGQCGEFADSIEQRLNELREHGFIDAVEVEQPAAQDLRDF